jgi:hypothetical protein
MVEDMFHFQAGLAALQGGTGVWWFGSQTKVYATLCSMRRRGFGFF